MPSVATLLRTLLLLQHNITNRLINLRTELPLTWDAMIIQSEGPAFPLVGRTGR